MNVIFIKINGKFQACYHPIVRKAKVDGKYIVYWQDFNGEHEVLTDKIYTEEEYEREIRNAD